MIRARVAPEESVPYGPALSIFREPQGTVMKRKINNNGIQWNKIDLPKLSKNILRELSETDKIQD